MLVIVGDSHISAMRDAFLQRQDANEYRSSRGDIRIAQLGYGYHFLEPFFEVRDHGVGFTQDTARAVFTRLNFDGVPVIEPNDSRSFVFVFGLYPSLGFNQKYWKTHTAAIWAEDRQFVSQAAFDAIIDDLTRQPMAFFEKLLSMGVRFSVASCCPVPASYKTGADDPFEEHEISFIYDRFRDRVCAKLDALGIAYHLPPREIYDEHGAMRDEFALSPGDYHANADYGRLMLAKILREIDDTVAPADDATNFEHRRMRLG